tara:strand:+ start:2104 stop:2667 length:564 start_codon:yes stop_codon:yes gene_type:complete
MIGFKDLLENKEFFPKEPITDITLPGPNFDLDAACEKLKQLMKTRTAENERSIRMHDERTFYAIEQYCKKNKLEHDSEEMQRMSDQAIPTIMHYKNKFDLIRPHKHDNSIKPMESTTNKTPAYPSGHAAQSIIVGLHMASKHPQHKENLIEAAKECGYGRVLAGFHYMQDFDAGNLLGEKMYSRMRK